MMAILLYRKNDATGALAELDEGIKTSKEPGPLYYQKGQILEGTGDTAAAQKAYEKTIALMPTYTDAVLALKRLETKKGP